MKVRGKHLGIWIILLIPVAFCICVALGSVQVPMGQAIQVIWGRLIGQEMVPSESETILISVRIPRVMNAALVGACLSLAGSGMQGLLQNPLADGSTMGVSSGAALGALTALVLGWSIPWLPLGGMVGTAVIFAMGAMALVLWFANRMDRGLSNTTMVLLGVVFSMFASSLISLITALSGEKLRSVTFWLMGSLASGSYASAAWLAGALAVGMGILMPQWRALDALALGEYQAQHLGIHIRLVKIRVIVGVSLLTGACVSVGGGIAFVGLIVPHFVRLTVGPSHKGLLIFSACGGCIFLMMADLLARIMVAPRELPVGVITSLVGAATFGVIFFRKGRVAS